MPGGQTGEFMVLLIKKNIPLGSSIPGSRVEYCQGLYIVIIIFSGLNVNDLRRFMEIQSYFNLTLRCFMTNRVTA